MDILFSILKWSTIINGALLLVYSVFIMFAKDWMYKMHNRFLALERARFEEMHYLFIGLFKVFYIFFNLVPLMGMTMALQ